MSEEKNVLTEDEVKRILIKELPKYIRTNEEIRHIFIGIMSETFVTREEMQLILKEIRDLREDFNQRMEEHSKRMEEHSKRIEEHSKRIEEHSRRIEEFSGRIEEHSGRIEEHSGRIEEHSRRIEELTRAVNDMSLRMTRLDTKWGMITEDTFRNALKGILEKYFGMEVKKWRVYDDKGEVFNIPRFVEVDIMVKDNEHILIEIKGSLSIWDIFGLTKIADFYKKKEKPDKVTLYIVSTYIPDEVQTTASHYGVQCFTANMI